MVNIQQIAAIATYILSGAVILGFAVWGIWKMIKSKDPEKAKGSLMQWLGIIFSVVESVYSGEGNGKLKFQAAKKLILERGLLPEPVKALLGSPQFDPAVEKFIEENFKKVQDIWIAAGQHKPRDK